jgi:hypothetical protein
MLIIGEPGNIDSFIIYLEGTGKSSFLKYVS